MINALAQSTPVLVNLKEHENDKDEIVEEHKDDMENNKGTQVLIGQVDTPAFTTQDQGAFVNLEKENDKTEELGMTTKPKE